MEDFQEIGAIWRGETRRALKSGRVLVLLILFLLFVGLALTVGAGLSKLADSQRPQGVSATTDPATEKGSRKELLHTFVTEDEAMLESLAAIPLLLLGVFKVTLRFLPMFIALMGFDQLAGEIAPKSIRYLVVRVKRSSIILGKLLSQVTLFALLMSLCTLLMVLVTKVLNPATFSSADVALWTVKLIIASMVLSLAYLSLTALFSAVVRQGGVALVLNIISLFVIWFVALFGGSFRFPGEVPSSPLAMLKSESVLAYLRYASVWHYGDDLLHPHWGRFFTAALVHVGFGLVFLGLAHLALRRRDL